MKLRCESAAEISHLVCHFRAMLLSMSVKSKFGLFETSSNKYVNLLNYCYISNQRLSIGNYLLNDS